MPTWGGELKQLHLLPSMLPTKKWATTYRNPLKLIVGVDLLKQKAVEAKEFI